jgi:M6 family metalloprotease-like protein
MYSSSYPGLDHYWREVSYNQANVAGSTAVNWVQLPHPSSYYAYEDAEGWQIDLNGMFNDCTAAADPHVDFRDYDGINMMFNATFGPWAWGGSRWASLDGATRSWSVTWEPPWGYDNSCVIAHEMGHGFGLRHSNNADNDGYPYDNPWDVMSDSWSRALSHSTYGTLGKHTIAYHKDKLGWIPSGQRFEVSADGRYWLTIDNLEMATVTNYRMAKIMIPSSSRFYTVEVRDLVGYDGNLPGYAVIIHEVDEGRQEPAWLVDAENLSDGADEGAMWRSGECFDDAPNQISVCVEDSTADGFDVRIEYGDVSSIFDDGFETGGLESWS